MDEIRQTVEQISKSARNKGIGNVDFSLLHEIRVSISPGQLCEFYAVELHDAMIATVSLMTGNPDATIPFTGSDLHMYLMILLRERIRDVRKQRVLFKAYDVDVLIPHFYYVMLHHVGDVTDELHHLWIHTFFDDSEIAIFQDQWETFFDETEHGKIHVRQRAESSGWYDMFKIYQGEDSERAFVYDMSRHLKALERWGFVNGKGLPRGREGDLSFMLFYWIENRLYHHMELREPGTVVLASLINFARSTNILNPYIPYGPINAFKVLLKDLTVPRGKFAS